MLPRPRPADNGRVSTHDARDILTELSDELVDFDEFDFEDAEPEQEDAAS